MLSPHRLVDSDRASDAAFVRCSHERSIRPLVAAPCRAHWRRPRRRPSRRRSASSARRTAAAASPTFDAQRIEFAPGTDRATRAGSVDPTHSDRWILNARAGQTMALNSRLDRRQHRVRRVHTGPSGARQPCRRTRPRARRSGRACCRRAGDYIGRRSPAPAAPAVLRRSTCGSTPRCARTLGLLQRAVVRPGYRRPATVGGSVLLGATDRWYLTAERRPDDGRVGHLGGGEQHVRRVRPRRHGHDRTGRADHVVAGRCRRTAATGSTCRRREATPPTR